MDISAKKILLALIIGTIVMVVIDYAFGKITNSLYVLPFSVLVGALVTGILVIKRAWLIGIVVGVINSAITIAIYNVLGPSEINLFKTLVYPVSSFLLAGLVGGYFGGIIGARFTTH
jgi:hypothetical protein